MIRSSRLTPPTSKGVNTQQHGGSRTELVLLPFLLLLMRILINLILMTVSFHALTRTTPERSCAKRLEKSLTKEENRNSLVIKPNRLQRTA